VRAVIGVAVSAGLRQGEIRGIWWEDDDGEVLNIRRSVWARWVGPPMGCLSRESYAKFNSKTRLLLLQRDTQFISLC
jgi:hypothetical protein